MTPTPQPAKPLRERLLAAADYSGNHATAKPDIAPTEREHILGLVALLREAAEAVAVDGWQPIETAPKDGTYVLVANAHGAWVASWRPIYTSGYRPSNPWASVMLNHNHIPAPGRYDKPTLWRPLAAPSPSISEESNHG